MAVNLAGKFALITGERIDEILMQYNEFGRMAGIRQVPRRIEAVPERMYVATHLQGPAAHRAWGTAFSARWQPPAQMSGCTALRRLRCWSSTSRRSRTSLVCRQGSGGVLVSQV